MRSAQQNKDSIIYKHARKVDNLEHRLYRIIEDINAKEDNTKVKAGANVPAFLIFLSIGIEKTIAHER